MQMSSAPSTGRPGSRWRPGRLLGVSGFPHVADRQHDHRVVEHAMSGDIARCPESDEKLTGVRSIWIGRTQEREAREGGQPVDDDVDGASCSVGVLLRQESMKSFEVGRSVPRKDYLCHFGKRLGL